MKPKQMKPKQMNGHTNEAKTKKKKQYNNIFIKIDDLLEQTDTNHECEEKRPIRFNQVNSLWNQKTAT